MADEDEKLSFLTDSACQKATKWHIEAGNRLEQRREEAHDRLGKSAHTGAVKPLGVGQEVAMLDVGLIELLQLLDQRLIDQIADGFNVNQIRGFASAITDTQTELLAP